jgi:hypothetical protein
MRISLSVTIFLTFVACFFFAETEILKVLSILIIVGVVFFSTPNIFNKNNKIAYALLFLSGSIFVAYALIARDLVINEADKYAIFFVNTYKCAPTLKDLIDNDSKWTALSSTVLTNNIEKMGYSRNIIYHSNIGLLKYGFLYDDNRVIKLKLCKPTDKTGKRSPDIVAPSTIQPVLPHNRQMVE